MTEGSDPSPILGEIDALAREAHVPIRLVSLKRLESVQGTEAPQGVVAFADALEPVLLEQLVFGEDAAGSSGQGRLGQNEEHEDDELEGSGDMYDELDIEDDDDEEDEDDEDSDEGASDAVEFTDEAGEHEDDADGEATAAKAQTETVESVAAADDDFETVDVVEVLETAERPGSEATPASKPVSEQATDRVANRTINKATAPAPEADHPPVQAGAFLLLVDGVTDPQNLGAILRSAECAGASGVVIPRHRSAHVTPAVTKAAAGAIEYLPMALVAGIPSALQDLERLGVLTIGLDERGSTTLFDLDIGDRPVAIVLGAEGRGLAPLARRRCEILARIPMGGEVSSLNVAAAAAVACFEVARQRKR
jgi:23S rRNA (guanosine2251-2'-O)-methyltransferase